MKPRDRGLTSITRIYQTAKKLKMKKKVTNLRILIFDIQTFFTSTVYVLINKLKYLIIKIVKTRMLIILSVIGV